MRALRAVAATAAAAVMGIGLAALPHGENYPCVEHLEEVVGNPHREFSWFPLGHRCAPSDFVGASTAMTLVWMVLAGILVAAALWRPTVPLRGAVVAAATLALAGWTYMRVQPFVPAVGFSGIIAAPIAFALLRAPGVLVPPLVLAVWVFPYLIGYAQAAMVLGIAAGAGAPWAAQRLLRR